MRRIALFVLTMLALAPTAAAQETNAPPGNSGIDEYLESVPSASGNTPSGGVAAGKAKPSAAVVQALRNRGKTGAELQRLIANSNPTGGAKHKSSSRHPGSRLKGSTPGAQGSGPVRAAVGAATGSGGGMGVWLAGVLGAVALAALSLLVVRIARTRATST